MKISKGRPGKKTRDLIPIVLDRGTRVKNRNKINILILRQSLSVLKN